MPNAVVQVHLRVSTAGLCRLCNQIFEGGCPFLPQMKVGKIACMFARQQQEAPVGLPLFSFVTVASEEGGENCLYACSAVPGGARWPSSVLLRYCGPSLE